MTALTGLFLFVGVVMVGQVTGHYQLSDLPANKLPLAEHKTWFTVAMVLMLLGAFGKSAQFPFHLWLPNAMAAPTPVSAYLHSAAMVELAFLRFLAVFGKEFLFANLSVARAALFRPKESIHPDFITH